MVKIFMTEIHGESHPVSMHIPVMYPMTWYFHMDFHINALLVKLYPYQRMFIHVMDHTRLLPGGPCSSEGPTVATKVLSPH